MDPVDCRIFDEQLDAAERGDLSGEGLALMHSHAAECGSCGALLRLREELPGPSLATLEARVPDRWVDDMEARVREALEAPPQAGPPQPRPSSAASSGRRPSWTPLLVAATVVLLMSTALSLVALDRARDRTAVLGAELVDQQRRLVALETAAGLGDATPGNALRAGWVRSLRSRDEITVAELRALLDRLPDEAHLASAARLGALSRARWAPPRWRRAMEAVPADGTGFTVAAARVALDRLDLPDDAALPAARLLDLIS